MALRACTRTMVAGACVGACVCACVLVCVRACVRAGGCMWVRAWVRGCVYAPPPSIAPGAPALASTSISCRAFAASVQMTQRRPESTLSPGVRSLPLPLLHRTRADLQGDGGPLDGALFGRGRHARHSPLPSGVGEALIMTTGHRKRLFRWCHLELVAGPTGGFGLSHLASLGQRQQLGSGSSSWASLTHSPTHPPAQRV